MLPNDDADSEDEFFPIKSKLHKKIDDAKRATSAVS
jgi:hypothetical protein